MAENRWKNTLNNKVSTIFGKRLVIRRPPRQPDHVSDHPIKAGIRKVYTAPNFHKTSQTNCYIYQGIM